MSILIAFMINKECLEESSKKDRSGFLGSFIYLLIPTIEIHTSFTLFFLRHIMDHIQITMEIR